MNFSEKIMSKKEHTKLYVGFDDSNHAGKTSEEIIVAVFSNNYKDSLIKKCPKRRNFQGAGEFLNNSGRDFRFTTLEHEGAKKNFNLPLVAPYLIKNYIRFRDNLYKISLFFDGPFEKRWEEIIEEDLREFNIKIKNFSGPNKYRCPEVLCVADTKANLLFKGVNVDYEKYVKIDSGILEERIKLF